MCEKEKDLVEKIGKMKRNRDAVPKQLLASVYAVPYKRLQDEIKGLIESLIFDCLKGVQVEYGSAEAVLRALSKAYTEGGYDTRLGKAAFIDMDADEVLRIVEEVRNDYIQTLHTIADTIPGMVRFKDPGTVNAA